MIYLLILSNIVSLIALYKSNKAQKDNFKTLELLYNHASIDYEGHKKTIEILTLLYKRLLKGGADT